MLESSWIKKRRVAIYYAYFPYMTGIRRGKPR
ncbi:hypothetical protein EPYR_02498 [Erwinia pyrifoliae DSM 12163]|nr:hypothetical protein EPYR_02498 [Erwinia pyrifoliae DSM 12163]